MASPALSGDALWWSRRRALARAVVQVLRYHADGELAAFEDGGVLLGQRVADVVERSGLPPAAAAEEFFQATDVLGVVQLRDHCPRPVRAAVACTEASAAADTLYCPRTCLVKRLWREYVRGRSSPAVADLPGPGLGSSERWAPPPAVQRWPRRLPAVVGVRSSRDRSHQWAKHQRTLSVVEQRPERAGL